MNIKKIKPGDFAIVKYFETVQPEFKKHGLELVATFTEFKIVEEKNGNSVFECDNIAAVDGFIRGIVYGTKK